MFFHIELDCGIVYRYDILWYIDILYIVCMYIVCMWLIVSLVLVIYCVVAYICKLKHSAGACLQRAVFTYIPYCINQSVNRIQ